MPAIPPDKMCPDCRGRGSILLLTRTVPCKRCEGRGYLLTSCLDLVIDDLRIAGTSRAALKRLGATTLRDVTKLTEDQLLRVPDMTRPAVDELKKTLATLGLGFRKG